MTVFYLTTEDVIELYTEHVGEPSGLLRRELLESAVALPQASMFGEDLYPHVFTKAAAMLRWIAENQPFIDGNKRIAWIATRVFLAANGFDVTASVDDGLGLMVALAIGRSTSTALGLSLPNAPTSAAMPRSTTRPRSLSESCRRMDCAWTH